ncbi:MAG: hypothetical protein U0R50_04195 [Gaiellales bacterium]
MWSAISRRGLVPSQEVSILKALGLGVCALLLCLTPVVARAGSPDPAAELDKQLAAMHKDETVIRFFVNHEWLLHDPRFQNVARARLAKAKRHLELTRARAAQARLQLAERRATRRMAMLNRQPRRAICHVFRGYCGEALQVARCESRFSTTARNGQYLGLFQMGESERRIYGHGPTALEQSRAAHRYFVRSGRDWSPWSCKPW